MPKVKMKVSMVGSEFSYIPGDVIEVNDEVAEAWTVNNIAELFVPPEENAIVHKEIVEALTKAEDSKGNKGRKGSKGKNDSDVKSSEEKVNEDGSNSK